MQLSLGDQLLHFDNLTVTPEEEAALKHFEPSEQMFAAGNP